MLVRVKERLLKAIVCGDWIKRACCRMAGEEEFGYFCLSEGTEGEEGSLAVDVVGLSSCVCGAENWLLIDLVLCVKNMAKSSAVEVVEGDRGES